MPCDSVRSFVRLVSVMVFTALLFLPTVVFAQSPWERAASNLERTFTGPLARWRDHSRSWPSCSVD